MILLRIFSLKQILQKANSEILTKDHVGLHENLNSDPTTTSWIWADAKTFTHHANSDVCKLMICSILDLILSIFRLEGQKRTPQAVK